MWYCGVSMKLPQKTQACLVQSLTFHPCPSPHLPHPKKKVKKERKESMKWATREVNTVLVIFKSDTGGVQGPGKWGCLAFKRVDIL